MLQCVQRSGIFNYFVAKSCRSDADKINKIIKGRV